MKKFFLIAFFTLSSCTYLGLNTRFLYEENGKKIYKSTCDGDFQDIGDCYTAANKECPQGFEILDKDSVASVSSTNTTFRRTIIYYCK